MEYDIKIIIMTSLRLNLIRNPGDIAYVYQ